MRNIKSTLRIMRNSALLFVAASGAAYLTGCSSDIDSPNSGGNSVDENVTVESLGVTAGNNPSLAKTYSNSHQIGTRAEWQLPKFPYSEIGEVKDLPTEFTYTLDDAFKNNPELKVNIEDEYFDIAQIPGIEAKYYEWDKDHTQPYYELKGVAVKVPAGTYHSLPEKFKVYYIFPGYNDTDGTYHQTWQKEITVCDIHYYIYGDVITGHTGNDDVIKISILPNATFSDKNDIQSNTTVYLYEKGKLLRASATDNQIYIRGRLISKAPIGNEYTEIYMMGNCYTLSSIHGKYVELNNSGEIYAGCSVTATEEIYFTNSSVMEVGYISAPIIHMDSSPSVTLRDGGYMFTETLKIDNIRNNTSGVRVYGEEGEYAMVETDVLSLNGHDAIDTFRNLGILYKTYTGNEEPYDEPLFHNSSVNANGKGGKAYSVIEDPTDDCSPKKAVAPTNPPVIPGNDQDEEPGPELENIGSVAPSDGIDHTHPISATCVSTYGNNAYLSWHTQGEKFHGCIEYLTVANGTATLNGYLETAPSENEYAIDFNHVIFDDGKIFVAGDHPKKGGILGWIYCNDANGFVTGQANLYMRALYEQKYEKEGEDPKYANSGSGNCIIRNGNYYQVASIKGFETFNVGDFASEKYIVTDENGVMKFAAPKSIARLGSWTFDSSISADPTTYDSPRDGTRTGKHIATDGSKVVMLTLINRNNTSNTATASIKVYAASDVTYENCLASYEVTDAVLSPVDGKDVIAIKGDDIWVCLGNGGVQHLKLSGNSISKVSEFVLKAQPQETLKNWGMSQKEADSYCANGLAVDDKYVYVAHGGAGLIVLNKEDLTFVTRTRYNGGKSANYVKLSSETFSTDQYIYVAYGMSNLQIFAWRRSNN